MRTFFTNWFKQQPTKKSILEDLRTFFINNGDDAGADKLWDIISALRGPDDGNHDLKYATTEVIRYHVTGKSYYANVSADNDGKAKYRDELVINQYDHFIQHAMKAFRSLNLNWRTNNDADA
jgi:hypothetical protein